MVGDRKKIEVTMDWTDFGRDDQTTLVLSLVLRNGRAIPLVWLNVRKSDLKDKRSMHERTAVQELRHALSDDVRLRGCVRDEGEQIAQSNIDQLCGPSGACLIQD